MRSLTLVTATAVSIACGGSTPDASSPSSSVSSATPSPSPSAPAAPPKEDGRFSVSESGELSLPSPIGFVVRPLAGPGSMGPSELSPDSDAALTHVADYVRSHPAADVRIECAVNAIKMSSGPNSGRGAYLSQLVARWLVDRGISCKRLETVGVLERNADAPAERVRVFTRRSAPREGEARADPCGTTSR